MTERYVYILSPADEMRYPYERALKSISLKAIWFSDTAALLKYEANEKPVAIVVDIDLLSRPYEPSFEKIRLAFPSSDVIGLSSSDSSQLAVLTLRSGFSDYLLKPSSPEELLWSLRKSLQRHELFLKFDDAKLSLVRAFTQISACSTPALVQLVSLEYLQQYLKAQGAVWLQMKKPHPEVLCSLPKALKAEEVLKKLPSWKMWRPLPPAVTWSRKSRHRKVFLACQNNEAGVFLWGIDSKVGGEKLYRAKTLLEHAELSLLNLQKYDEIKQQTFVDELTGLYNSRYLRFAITNSINRSKKPGGRFSILFIDVDHFKNVNTQYGHIIGSEFLVAIGKTIRNNVRGIDPVFRYGGDEFVVVLNDADTEGAREIAERIRQNIERRVFSIQGHKLHSTVSIGIAVYPDHALDQEAILKMADEAMYSAKEHSRNAVHIYAPPEATKTLKIAAG